MKGMIVTSILICLVGWMIFFEDKKYVRATVDPIANNITITSSTGGQFITSFDLIDDTTKNLYLHGSFTDGDGCQDVRDSGNIEAVVYRSGLPLLEQCIASNFNCYKGSISHGECVVTGCDSGEEIVANYECSIPLQYYADATDAGQYVDDNWVGFIKVIDASSASSTIQSAVEINSLTAISFNELLNYGTMSLGATSSVQTVAIRNVGNTSVDVRVSGTEMVCTRGTIPVSYQHFDRIATTTFENSQQLGALGIVLETNLPKYYGGASIANIYLFFRKGVKNMSKYLVSAGVVWVFLAFIIGIMILLVPVKKQGATEIHYITVESKNGETTSPNVVSNIAKTSVSVEGTADGAENAAQTSVGVLKK